MKKSFKGQRIVNECTMSGFIFRQPSFKEKTTDKKTYARFTLMQGQGKDKATGEKRPALFQSCVIFKEEGKEIPWALLRNQTLVVVSGKIRPDVYTNKEGRRIQKTELVVRSIVQDKLVDIEYDAPDADESEAVDAEYFEGEAPQQGEMRA